MTVFDDLDICPFCGRPYEEHDRSCTEEIDEIVWSDDDEEAAS